MLNDETNDNYWMAQALECAERSLFLSAPNPRVGCVIVQNNALVAQGFTQQAGQAHAEMMALTEAQNQGFTDFSQCTFYVTLEPCSHYGRTKPCVDAIIDVAPKRVVIAMPDPNPQIAGRGIAQLKAAGIEVRVGVLLQAESWLNVGFVCRLLENTPRLWLNIYSYHDGINACEDLRGNKMCTV